MAYKSKNKKAAKKKQPSSKVSSEIRHLETLLEYTLRAKDGRSESLDDLFNNQAARIQLRLDIAKGKQ